MTEKSKTKRNHVIWSREEYLRQKAASTEKMEIHLTNNYAFHRVFKCEKVVKGFLMALLNLGEEEIVQLEISECPVQVFTIWCSLLTAKPEKSTVENSVST